MSATQLNLAANAKSQAINFAICLAVGIVAGVATLLYFRRSSTAEMFLTDLFATLVLGGGYIACLELVFGGKFELYGLAGYLFGTAIIPAAYKLAIRAIAKKQKEKKNTDTTSQE
ncbi:MAG: hypothetical protein II867_03795 [Clostridia bacterium]|nr:hypothetical protein [Clostridia bacterium]